CHSSSLHDALTISKQIIINGYTIQTDEFQVEVWNEKPNRKKVNIVFQVTHEDYHDVTTLLYENDFTVEIPSQHMEFPATIHAYSTSIDNLYEEGAVGT